MYLGSPQTPSPLLSRSSSRPSVSPAARALDFNRLRPDIGKLRRLRRPEHTNKGFLRRVAVDESTVLDPAPETEKVKPEDVALLKIKLLVFRSDPSPPTPVRSVAMSGRLVRRVLKEKEQLAPTPEPELDVDEEEEESGSPAPSRNPFDLLDDQEDEEEVANEENVEVVIPEEYQAPKNASTSTVASNHKSKKKKKKKKEPTEKSLDLILKDLSINTNPSTHQVGFDSAKVASNEVQTTTKKLGTSLLVVDPKYLKAENELRKIFGSKVVSSFENSQNRHGAGSSRSIHGGRRVAHNPRKTILITPSIYWPRWDGSLSMELIETKDGVHYFRYLYSQSYAQEAFEAAKAINDLNAIANVLAHHPYHIDSLLTFAEVFKFSGEHQSSADVIGKCLYAMECAWHPLFSPLHGNCQLKYSHDTNKSLFTALFSHMKNMDRRGCHRSALEVCKLLLSLDSDDPKGALFCIDYFALRAQEHKWLEQFSEEYKSDSSMWMFPNFSYSLAVCRFYLERDDTKVDPETEKAMSSDLMKQALLLHPLVLQKLVDKAPLKDSAWTQILKSPFFGSAKAGSPTLERLIDIYVERSYLIWRTPDLQKLLKDAALQVIETLKHSNSEARDWACVRKEAFSSEKNEYSHLLVSDFSDTTPSLPPEELRQFMVGPQLHQQMHDINGGGVDPERAHVAPREVVGRNAAVVFLESLLPWINYGDDRNERDAHDQDDN